MPPYKDLADLPEDERIAKIAQKVAEGLTIGFFVDSEPADKADRYIKKLKKKCPGLRVLHRGPGLVAKTLLIKVRLGGEG